MLISLGFAAITTLYRPSKSRPVLIRPVAIPVAIVPAGKIDALAPPLLAKHPSGIRSVAQRGARATQRAFTHHLMHRMKDPRRVPP